MKEKKNEKRICAAIFSAMFLFLLMQFHHVMVYFDDYGYYSLSYGMPQAAGGNEFGFGELLSFLKAHYFDVNGRIPGYLLWLSLYILGGLPMVQTAAAILVLLILIVLWKFIDNKQHPVLSAVMVCAFYGLISLEMHRQGTYWFAAFFQYVAPVSAIVGFLMLYFKYRENGFSVKQMILLSVLTVLAGYSQEQLGMTVAFMMCLIWGYELIHKKAGIHNLLFTALAFLCVAALLLSPSSRNRAAGSGYTFAETIIYSTYKVLRSFFAPYISGLIILLYLAVFIFSLKMLANDKHIFKLMDVCGILLSVVSICIYLIRPLLSALGDFTLNRYYMLIAVGVPCVAVIAIQIMRYYRKSMKDADLLLFMTAVGSVGCLCFVPEVPPRLFISSWLLLFPLLADGLFSFAEHMTALKGKHKNGLLYLCCGLVIAVSAINLGQIYRGYSANAEVYKYNDQQLQLAAEQQKFGESVDKVYLKTLPYPECAAALIYDEEVTYMKHWMNSYYDFTSIPSFYFNERGEENILYDTYIDQGNQVFVSVP